MIFLGPLYPLDKEDEIRNNLIVGGSTAPNVFQWNLLKGLRYHLGDNLKVFNVLPIGIWPIEYKKLFFKDSEWSCMGINGQEIGSINLPFLKQLERSVRVKKILKNIIKQDREIIIYSAYMPFLKAIYRLPRNVKITVIITDLPEFYDLGNVSKVRKVLRNIQNKMIYRYLNRVDRFVVLTKQMCEPLRIGNRPWVCVEGICDETVEDSAIETGTKKVILYSGTLHYQYGIKNLLHAFKQIEDENIELWICGCGEAEEEIRQLEKENIGIKYFGFCSQSEVAKLRARAHILVNPRTNEGEYTKFSFPSKTMEYMISGKPVVMYKLDGIPDEYDEYLFYVNNEDHVQGLKQAIDNVLHSYEDALLRAKDAKEFVLNNKNAIIQSGKILLMCNVNIRNEK